MPSPSPTGSPSPSADIPPAASTENAVPASPPPAASEELPSILPPSISPEKLLAGETYTYTSPIPAEILANPTVPVILGVDEAGRGPVLGPMVYAAAYCLETYSDTIKELGFADSKKMTHQSRAALMSSLSSSTSTISPHLGWTTTLLSPSTISTGMLRPPTHPPYNLNTLAHDTTISLIRSILALNVNLKQIYVDTVGVPSSYQAKLSKLFPTLQVTVTKQADSLFPVVSAASVCAKVTRDVALNMLVRKGDGGIAIEELGSGYPGDAKTIGYLKKSMDPVFGWRQEVVRFSWATAKDMLDKDKRAVPAKWSEGSEDGPAITGFLTGKDGGVEKGVAGWYGRNAAVMDF